MNELVKKESSEVVETQHPMHPLVSMSMSSGTDLTPETLGQLLTLQREWEADQARKAYSAAMVKFRSVCPNIEKDANVNYKTNKGITNYDHETLNGIMKTITPALSECGINPTYRTGVEGATIIVTCRITHELGHYEETSLPAAADTSGGKNAIQSVGSTVTYLQRYTLKAMLGLSAGFDNDSIENQLEPQQNIYTDERLADNFPKWIESVENGSRRAMAIITHISNSWVLTEGQLIKLNSLIDYEPIQGEVVEAEAANA